MSAFLGVVYRAYNQGGPFSPLFGSKIKRVERRHGAAQRKLDVFFFGGWGDVCVFTFSAYGFAWVL